MPAVLPPGTSSWIGSGFECRGYGCRCCKPLDCFNGAGIEWIEIPAPTPGFGVECITIPRLYIADAEPMLESDSARIQDPLNGFRDLPHPCSFKWVISTEESSEQTLFSFWCSANTAGEATFKRTKLEVFLQLSWLTTGGWGVFVYVVETLWVISPNFGPLLTGGTLAQTTIFQAGRNPETGGFLGIESIGWSGDYGTACGNSGPSGPQFCNYHGDFSTTTSNPVKAKFCSRVVCTPPACRCWNDAEDAYADVPRTAYLDVCGGTVLPGHSSYTGCSNGAYSLACGPQPGTDPQPCWKLSANCGSPYSFSFDCNVAGISSPGGFILNFSYTASQIFYRIISYSNVDRTSTPNLILACEITGSVTAELKTPTACPTANAPACGFGALSREVNYFTFPFGDINNRTPRTHAEFLTLAANAFAPICDYTTASVDLDFV
jgi:hypothetical protein